MVELGNLAFGNPGKAGDCKISREWESIFDVLLESLGVGYHGTEYVNDVFEMHMYDWTGECTCGAGDESENHLSNCVLARPNFWYKPTDYKLEWYKYPLRDSYANQDISRKEFAKMVLDCADSVERDNKNAKS